MRKNLRFYLVIVSSLLMFGYWAALFFTHTKDEMINYWWQAFLAVQSILYGFFGFVSAKHWSWLKSGMGRAVFSISLGLIMWGIGQALWTAAVIKDPSQQSPPSNLISVVYFFSIPLWTYGIFQLSRATGARYGLRSLTAKVLVVVVTAVIFALSYVVLVNIARGGVSYFHQGYNFWYMFFDLSYAAGDAINLVVAAVIFGLSWKYLGGMFKRPILVMLLAFVLIFLADFVFSYRDGKGWYYNGDWSDLLYLATIATFGLGVCMLDPGPKSKPALATAPVSPAPTAPNPAPATVAAPNPAPVIGTVAPAPVAATEPKPDLPSISPEPAGPVNNPEQPQGGQ